VVFRRRLQPPSGFWHEAAQRFEESFARSAIEADFPGLLDRWRVARAEGSLWHSADDQWFQGDVVLFETFVEHVRSRRCLEIGSGPFGYLGPCWWVADPS
jgi:hypothetical protein